MISEDEVKHIAKLARLTLTEKEIKTFSTQLSDVFEYVELLNSVDTEGVEETSQVTGLQNVTEKDEITRKCDGEDLLLCSPLPKERKQVRVKPVIKM
ncbi:Asp-tRNA(Asn)/Glu-tRNA(Gln) amidotransferase subunit GatC [Patescibacteria group bacterium]